MCKKSWIIWWAFEFDSFSRIWHQFCILSSVLHGVGLLFPSLILWNEISNILGCNFLTKDWPVNDARNKIELELSFSCQNWWVMEFDFLLHIWHQIWILSFSISHGTDSVISCFIFWNEIWDDLELNFHGSDQSKDTSKRQRKEKKKTMRAYLKVV